MNYLREKDKYLKLYSAKEIAVIIFNDKISQNDIKNKLCEYKDKYTEISIKYIDFFYNLHIFSLCLKEKGIYKDMRIMLCKTLYNLE